MFNQLEPLYICKVPVPLVSKYIAPNVAVTPVAGMINSQ